MPSGMGIAGLLLEIITAVFLDLLPRFQLEVSASFADCHVALWLSSLRGTVA